MKRGVLASILFVVGFVLLVGPNITGGVIGIGGVSFSSIGLICMLIGSLMFVSGVKEKKETSFLENFLSKVVGTHPISKKKTESFLYKKVNGKNVNEIFQTPLGHKYGKEIMGAKAIVYKAYDGEYHVAFLTEAIDTHHRHAAATVARLVEGVNFRDPTYLDRKADALYEGSAQHSAELLNQCAGFELQYDSDKKKIIGIQQDSWLTKEQKRKGRKLSKTVEEDMILELLSNIDLRFLSKGLKNLDEKDMINLYAGRKVA